MVLPGALSLSSGARPFPAAQATAGPKETHLAQLNPECMGEMEAQFCLRGGKVDWGPTAQQKGRLSPHSKPAYCGLEVF